MIKKANTYHFCKFVMGKYKKRMPVLHKAFSNMTYSEKFAILNYDFKLLWRLVFPHSNLISKEFIKARDRFDFFCRDMEKDPSIRAAIMESRNINTIWEIPKGRLDELRNETELMAAIREFYEETSIDPSLLRIHWHLEPYVECYTDCGVKYKNTYYFADITDDIEVYSKFGNVSQYSEISDIKWCSKEDIKYLNLEHSTRDRLVKMFDKITKKYKLYMKNNDLSSKV